MTSHRDSGSSIAVCILISGTLSLISTSIVIGKFVWNWTQRTHEFSLIVILCAYDWIWAAINVAMAAAYFWANEQAYHIAASDPACYLQAYTCMMSINGELVTTACISHAVRLSMQRKNNEYTTAYYTVAFLYPLAYALM